MIIKRRKAERELGGEGMHKSNVKQFYICFSSARNPIGNRLGFLVFFFLQMFRAFLKTRII